MAATERSQFSPGPHCGNCIRKLQRKNFRKLSNMEIARSSRLVAVLSPDNMNRRLTVTTTLCAAALRNYCVRVVSVFLLENFSKKNAEIENSHSSKNENHRGIGIFRIRFVMWLGFWWDVWAWSMFGLVLWMDCFRIEYLWNILDYKLVLCVKTYMFNFIMTIKWGAR